MTSPEGTVAWTGYRSKSEDVTVSCRRNGHLALGHLQLCYKTPSSLGRGKQAASIDTGIADI